MQSGNEIFDQLLGNIDPTVEKQYGSFNFNVRVGCIKMAAPRHERFQFYLEMGSLAVDQLFKNEPFSSDVLTFVFPERFMSVHEQHAFTQALSKHQDVKNGRLKHIDILTSSSLIIGSFHKESILILSFNDDDKHNGVF